MANTTSKKAPVVNTEEQVIQNKGSFFKYTNWKEFIPMITFVLAFMLFVAGLFGTMYKANGTPVNSMEYFFKIAIQDMSQVNPEYELFHRWMEIARFDLIFISWFVAFIPSILILGYAVIKFIKFIVLHQIPEYNYKRLARWMLAFILPYVVFVNITKVGGYFINGTGQYQVNTIGWGPIVEIAGLAILVGTSIYTSRKQMKDNLPRYIIEKLSMILVGVMAITSFSSVAAGQFAADKWYALNPFGTINFLFFFNKWQAAPELMPAFIIAGLSVAVAGILVPFFARAKHSYTKVVFSFLMLGLGITSMFMMNAFKASNEAWFDSLFKVGPAAIMIVVFSGILFAMSTASLVVKIVKSVSKKK